MAEIDLIPTDYRRDLQVLGWLRTLGFFFLGLVGVLAVALAGLEYATRLAQAELEQLQSAEAAAIGQRAQLARLESEQADLRKRLDLLNALHHGTSARQMFVAVDRSLDGRVWFMDWKFRRAGELVAREPEAVHAGYFLVVPDLEQTGVEKAWLMQTHMEIRAQARDHTALADFVSRLVKQPEVAEVRVLQTQVREYTSSQVVDFELAVVVREGP